MPKATLRADKRRGSGNVEVIAPGIRVVTAPNPGPMTHTGTRSYLVGEGRVALIDPGPDDASHQRAIEQALRSGEQISHIFVTHSHLDHSPLARAMSETTGAPVLSFGESGAGRSDRMARLSRCGLIGGGEGIDADFAPDICLRNGDLVQGEGWTLEAVHTPGHLSNHMCFSLKVTPFLFTGDHVMGWSTTLVSPPDGDMTDFLASLRMLLERNDKIYLPGHGPVVKDGPHLVRKQLNHRKKRERQILGALDGSEATPAVIAQQVYRDLDPKLRNAAARNVFAHLIDLVDRGLVTMQGTLNENTQFFRT